MTWLAGVPAGTMAWSALRDLLPEPVAQLERLHRLSLRAGAPEVLELARLRMATLSGCRWAVDTRSVAALEAGFDEAKVEALDRWSNSPLLDSRERVTIDFAEQFAIEARGITDGQVDALLDLFGPRDAYSTIRAVWCVESVQRLTMTLDLDPEPEALGLVAARTEEV